VALLQIREKRVEQVGRYRVTLLVDAEGRIVGALVEGPRLLRPVYVAVNETAAPKLPKTVKRYLRRLGFRLE